MTSNIFQDLFNGRVLGIGREDQWLYLLRTELRKNLLKNKLIDNLNPEKKCDPADHGVSNFCISSTSDVVGFNFTSNNACSSASLWHKRLEHAPLRVRSRIAGLNMSLKEHNYTVYLITKHVRLPFPTSTSSILVFDIVHASVWGPYIAQTHDGERYFLTLGGDISKYTRIFLLHTKSDCITILRDFICIVKNQFGLIQMS